jgi:RHS repeat-associated protein
LQCEQTRWYDPTVGRWLSEDVVGFADSVNLYRYVGNSPAHRPFKINLPN